MKLNIGFKKYDLNIIDEEKMDELYPCSEEGTTFGLTDSSDKTIYINSSHPSKTVMETFMHEVTHALLWESGFTSVGTDEVFVDAFSKQILHFIETNNIDKIRQFLKAA